MLYFDGMFLKLKTMPGFAPICKQFGGRFNPLSGEWSFPPLCMIFDGLQRLIPELVIHESAKFFELPTGFQIKQSPLTMVSSGGLFLYQQQAVDFLISSPHHGSLLALSPGLGKTLTAIYAAGQLQAVRILVVAPLTLLPTWQREIMKWTGVQATICRKGMVPGEGWNITNYEEVVSRHQSYLSNHYDLLIVDESIKIKKRIKQNSKETQRSKIILQLAERATRVWLLSGSPVSKHADDLFTQLEIIEPRYFTSYWRFVNQYCLTEDTIWGTKVVGTRPDIDLRRDLRDLMFVRDQKEVLPELPDMLFETYECTFTDPQQKMYREMTKDFMIELETGLLTASTRLAQLTWLQQIVSCPEVFNTNVHSGKMNQLLNMFELDIVPMPVLIWANYHQTIKTLVERLTFSFPTRVIRGLSGETSESDRATILSEFQAGKIDILVLSLGVGKYGLTLTTAQSAVYYDKTFDGDAYVQSLSRIHRIGLDHVPVIFTLRIPGSTDRLIEMNLTGKMQSIHTISNADLGKLLGGLGTGEL